MIDGHRFWSTSFRACIVRGVIVPYSDLQPCVTGKSDLEVSEALWRTKLGQKKSYCDNDLCLSEVHTKLQLTSLIFVFLNKFVKVLKCYICLFDEIFSVNTEQLAIYE